MTITERFTVRLLAAPEVNVAVPEDTKVMHVLGDPDEIGAWDVDRAVPMVCVHRSATESKWSVEIAFEKEPLAMEYKYLVKRIDSNDIISWESIPGNRTRTISTAVNAAKGKEAEQSSTYESTRMPCPGARPAHLGNNGNTNGFQEWRCCRTNREANAWWQVDLGQEHSISRLDLWKSLTYHNRPKRPDARPPASSSLVSSMEAAPLMVLISNHPFTSQWTDPVDAKAPVFTQKFELAHDRRLETIELEENVVGRYVRLQQVSHASVLQFAELNVFVDDASEASSREDQEDDGFYGFEQGMDGDLKEQLEHGWLNPNDNTAQVRLWVGNNDETTPAIQSLLGSSTSQAFRVQMRYEQQTQCPPNERKRSWRKMDVDARSADVLDSTSSKLKQQLEQYKQEAPCPNAYLNTSKETLDTCELSADMSTVSWLHQLRYLTPLTQEQLKLLAEKVETETYAAGQKLMKYGERPRCLLFLRSGRVQLRGPLSSTGTHSVGMLETPCIANELGLFGRWTCRSASFHVESDVCVEKLSFDTLVQVLGQSTTASLRNNLIRNVHEYPSDSPSDVDHYVDTTRAQVFRVNMPLTALSKGSEQKLAYRIVFQVSSDKEDVGSAYLLPSQLHEHGEGTLTLPLLSAQGDGSEVMGQITVSYLLLLPFAHRKNTLTHVWRSYWRERAPLNIGHRGMGRSFKQVGGFRHALTRENTLASFLIAGRSGADFVEFDVQLTKDRIPVLYHDHMLSVGLEDRRAWSDGSKAEDFAIGIHDMTLRQLSRCMTRPVHEREETVLQKRLKKHWNNLVGTKPPKSPMSPAPSSPNDSGVGDDDHLVDFFPRLEDLLKHVPPSIGLNVEVKYPNVKQHAALRKRACFAMNEYVDTILQCVFDHAGERRIFFSCFDPEICVLLRAKQAKYPVFLLTMGRIETEDARDTLQAAVEFVRMEQLQGVVSNSDAMLQEPQVVDVVKRVTERPLLTWGDQNTSHESVQNQKRRGVDGVISDNIGDLLRQDQKLQSGQ